MPSKTRGGRATKASKENIGVVKSNNKLKSSGRALKETRKPLSDKTNSTSDDNITVISDKVVSVPIKNITEVCDDNVDRPRRARRLPTRYKENNTLKNLSNSFNSSSSKHESSPFKTPGVQKTATFVNEATRTQNPTKKATVLAKKKTSPLKKVLPKIPDKAVDCSKNRPKRICRLPSKFDDHSISPNKYTPLQPINASTPLARKTRTVNKENSKKSISISPVFPKKVSKQKTVSNSEQQKVIADTNNNAKKKPQISPLKSPGTPNKIFKTKETEKVPLKNVSIRLLDDNKNHRKRNSSKLDVYEFTFDPEEEPQPVKKKKKKAAPRKHKPKTVKVKSNYEKNLAQALAALKNAVSSKPNVDAFNQNADPIKENDNKKNRTPAYEDNMILNKEQSVSTKNYNSVRVEDIARDFQITDNDYVVDYSPVNSPIQPITPTDEVQCNNPKTGNTTDPLNLRDDLSFFDEVPVACSSMNVSVRHPQASPWRAEFGSLPIKWQVNTYVKPNMTPAFESSFINFNDNNSKKKHVYTNLVPETNGSLPHVENTSNLKQTSIISFIKEVVERNANKKKRKSTPVKTNSLFEDLTSTSIVDRRSPSKQTPLKTNTNANMTPESRNNNSDISNENNKESSAENINTPKDISKKADKNNTYFGFDDIEDQENVSPTKTANRARSLRSRTRGILQEINNCKGPTRAILPASVKSKQNILNQNEIKLAMEPPVLPEVAVSSIPTTNIQESCLPESLEDDDHSVHLFEDLDLLLIHHPKPNRKSYGKGKKVTFPKKPVAGYDDSSTSADEARAAFSSDEDNLEDLSFKLPSERPKKTIKKRKPKKQLSKKEEKEVEAWAAGFNSMCEDIDGFDLVVE